MSPLVRILLRYGAAFLVAKGWLTADDATSFVTDPDVEMLVGAAIGALVEGWYVLARKYGWQK